MNKEGMQKIYEVLSPLYDIVDAIDALIKDNKILENENKYLKERLEWHENVLKKNAEASTRAVGEFIGACLDGRITINDNKTIIEHK